MASKNSKQTHSANTTDGTKATTRAKDAETTKRTKKATNPKVAKKTKPAKKATGAKKATPSEPREDGSSDGKTKWLCPEPMAVELHLSSINVGRKLAPEELKTKATKLLEKLQRLHDDHALYECAFPDAPKHPLGVVLRLDAPRFGASPTTAFFTCSDVDWEKQAHQWWQALQELKRQERVDIKTLDEGQVLVEISAETQSDHDVGDAYVTLDQMAATVGRSKRTLEKVRSRRKNPLPAPDIQPGQGRGKPNEWLWSQIRPWLETEFAKRLPRRFPSSRFLDERAGRRRAR